MKIGRDVKVGLFVLAGLLFSAIVIFLIGDERRLFAQSADFKARFSDVQGLKSGAPIRMGGIDIGHVKSVGYSTDPTDPTIYVTLDIVKSESGRIRTDSKVAIVAKGLLGDKMVEITKGKAETMIPPGGEITSDEGNDVLAKATNMAAQASDVMQDIKVISSRFADQKLHDDLQSSVSALNTMLRQVTEGEGYPHKLLTDKDESERISRAVTSLERLSGDLSVTVRETNAILGRIKNGPGFAHDVIFGGGPQKQIEQFGAAANEAALALKGIRESDSLAHDIMYGGKGNGAEAIANVTALTSDLRVIVSGLKAGKGTIGALLVDPSIYEDLKSAIGNVERNDVLRALVRYSIKQDEKKPDVNVASGEGAKEAPPAPKP